MIKEIFKFLSDNYCILPTPIRVIVYCLLLVVLIYLLLLPRYIDGELVIKDNSGGGEIPFRGTIVSLKADGRLIKMTTNEDGMWAIPLASKLPFHSLTLNFINERKKYPVSIPFSKVIAGDVKVVFNEEDSIATFELAKGNKIHYRGLISTAYADPITDRTPISTAQPDSSVKSDSVVTAQKTYKIIREVIGKPDMVISDSMNFKDDLRMTNAKLSVLKYYIEKEYGFSASDEDWSDVNTVKNLDKFITQKQMNTNRKDKE